MLWYLHLCAVNHITVVDYQDTPLGLLEEAADGSGQFVRVLLRPVVKISADSDQAKAVALHHDAHSFCFIARSVTFPVDAEPEISVM